MSFAISDDLRELQRKVRRMVEERLKPHDAAIEAEGRIPEEALGAIRDLGLFGSHSTIGFRVEFLFIIFSNIVRGP